MPSNPKFQLLALLSLFFLPTPISATPNLPIWSKNAVSFPVACYNDSRPARQKICKPFKIVSPDGNSYVLVEYKRSPLNEDFLVDLRVVSGGKLLGVVGTPGFVEDEVLWSADSRAFAISGNSNANTDYHFFVYILKPSGLTRINPAPSAPRYGAEFSSPPRAKRHRRVP